MTSLTAPERAAPAEPEAPERTRSSVGRRLVPFGYLSPTVLLIVVLMVVPIIMVIGYSFRDNVIVTDDSEFAGLANYAKVLSDPDFLVALKNTAIFITASMVATVLGWLRDVSHQAARFQEVPIVYICRSVPCVIAYLALLLDRASDTFWSARWSRTWGPALRPGQELWGEVRHFWSGYRLHDQPLRSAGLPGDLTGG